MSQAQQKLLITLNPSDRSFGPITSPRSPTATQLFRSPHLSRTTVIIEKNLRKNSTDKSIKEKEILKDIKYSKPTRNVVKTEQSTPTTDLITYVNRMVDQNQQTKHKVRALSKGSHDLNESNCEKSGDKGQGLALFDSLSIVSGKKRSRVNEPTENYYIYWKNKAHEYLETNMKLMEQVRKLTRENQELKQMVQKSKIKDKAAQTKQIGVRVYDQAYLSKELRNLSTIYITKIEEMQKELKRKEIMVCSYEVKLHELNNKLQGDAERVKLMTKMKEQLDLLREQVHNLRMEFFKDDSSALNKSQTIELNTNSSSYWYK